MCVVGGMEGLVIVHPGKVYTDAEELGECPAVGQNRDLFYRIAEAAGSGQFDKCYFLPTGETYGPMKRIEAKSIIIPHFGTYEDQFVGLKCKLLEDGVDSVRIAGVKRGACVQSVQNLLSGKGLDWCDPINSGFYQPEGWGSEGYEKFCGMGMNARVIEDLTDSFNNYEVVSQEVRRAVG